MDSEYNARILVDFLQETSSGGVDDEAYGLDWHVRVSVEAIDPERMVKVAPFLYLSKDASLEAVPFGIALDKEEDKEIDGPDSVKIHGVKVVQKTLHSESSY